MDLGAATGAVAWWYQPSTGTFLSRDTFAGKLSTPFSLNRYTYAHNNPVRYWDPTGRCVGDVAVFCSNAQQRQAALATLRVANEFGPTKAKAGLGRLRDQVYVPAKVTGPTGRGHTTTASTPATKENQDNAVTNDENSIESNGVDVSSLGEGLVGLGAEVPLLTTELLEGGSVDYGYLESIFIEMQKWGSYGASAAPLPALYPVEHQVLHNVFAMGLLRGEILRDPEGDGYILASCAGTRRCQVWWMGSSIYEDYVGPGSMFAELGAEAALDTAGLSTLAAVVEVAPASTPAALNAARNVSDVAPDNGPFLQTLYRGMDGQLMRYSPTVWWHVTRRCRWMITFGAGMGLSLLLVADSPPEDLPFNIEGWFT